MKHTLELIAKKHLIWIDIVKSFGVSNETAEDITQEMYIQCLALIIALEIEGKHIYLLNNR